MAAPANIPSLPSGDHRVPLAPRTERGKPGDPVGQPYAALGSSEDGISRFLVLETCIAVRPDECFAPYGLAGLYAGTLTPNPLTPHAALFRQKVSSYLQRWNWLKVQEPRSEHVA